MGDARPIQMCQEEEGSRIMAHGGGQIAREQQQLIIAEEVAAMAVAFAGASRTCGKLNRVLEQVLQFSLL